MNNMNEEFYHEIGKMVVDAYIEEIKQEHTGSLKYKSFTLSPISNAVVEIRKILDQSFKGVIIPKNIKKKISIQRAFSIMGDK